MEVLVTGLDCVRVAALVFVVGRGVCHLNFEAVVMTYLVMGRVVTYLVVGRVATGVGMR